jgi:hypothetical protein
MDRVHVELVVPLLHANRHREAAIECLAAIAAATGPRRSPVAHLGAWLIRTGTRLEALGTPCPPSLTAAEPVRAA